MLGVDLKTLLQKGDQILIGKIFFVMKDDVAGVVITIQANDVYLKRLTRIINTLLHIDLILDTRSLDHKIFKFFN